MMISEAKSITLDQLERILSSNKVPDLVFGDFDKMLMPCCLDWESVEDHSSDSR